jgi:hypothetical protein
MAAILTCFADPSTAGDHKLHSTLTAPPLARLASHSAKDAAEDAAKEIGGCAVACPVALG